MKPQLSKTSFIKKPNGEISLVNSESEEVLIIKKGKR